jgi:hypothetical protein
MAPLTCTTSNPNSRLMPTDRMGFTSEIGVELNGLSNFR